ncbi:MAG: hemolysin family protein [Oligoflexales bacterium]
MIYILVVMICTLINACLSAFEMGLVSIKQASLKLLIDKGSKQATKLMDMRDNLESTLSTIQVGITIVAIISGTIAGKLTDLYGSPYLISIGVSDTLAEPLSMSIFVVLTTFITVVFGELVPKSIATKYPMNVSFFFAKAIRTANTAFLPLVKIFEVTTLCVLKTFDMIGMKSNRKDLEDADDAFAIHNLSKKHREYVYNLVNLQKTSLDDVLVDWTHVTKINTHMPDVEVENILLSSGHTRVPVMDKQEIKGLLNAKEFFASSRGQWQDLVHPVLLVNENAFPLNTLRRLQAKKSHMGIVVSIDDKSPLGIITIEDIFEEIVGEIFDEDDKSKNKTQQLKKRVQNS